MPRAKSVYQPPEDPEVLEWWSMTPAQRFAESEKLWATFLALGGSLEPEPDWQSPFYDPQAPRARIMFTIEFAEGVAADLAQLRTVDVRRILDRIDEQLMHQPTQPTRNRKPLVGLVPPWQHEDPTWELRIGKHRVFYDVDEPAGRVTIRAVREKPLHKTTDEIL